MVRAFLSFLLTLYILTGLRFGLALEHAMPAVNYLGVGYVTLTWPLHLKISPVAAPVAKWMFTFPRPSPKEGTADE